MEGMDGAFTFIGALLLCAAITVLVVFSGKVLDIYDALEKVERGALLVF